MEWNSAHTCSLPLPEKEGTRKEGRKITAAHGMWGFGTGRDWNSLWEDWKSLLRQAHHGWEGMDQSVALKNTQPSVACLACLLCLHISIF